MRLIEKFSFSSYRTILIVYCLLFAGLTSPFWLLGDVISPHQQHIDVGIFGGSQENENIENRKFTDYSHFFIPEISQHQSGKRSGWLTLWTNQNDMGRPTYHSGVFSNVYLPTWVMAQFTDDPFRVITIFSLLTAFLAGLFIIFFCREIGLSPLAGLIAGISLVSSPLFMYWLTFPMFLATFCWGAGALWAVARLAKKPGLLGWVVLAFAIFSLLMVARKQAVVYQAYVLFGFGLYLTYKKNIQFGWPSVNQFVLYCSTAVATGVVLAIPMHIDLLKIAAESARVSPDASFFIEILPKIGTLKEAVHFFVLSTTPELFGNPVSPAYPFVYNGLSVTPLMAFFALISLATSWRKTWGWWLVIVILCLLTFVHPLYEFAIKYLGLNISQGLPLGSITLPLIIIVAYGVDAIVKRTSRGDHSRLVWFAAAITLAILALGLGFGVTQAIPIRWLMVPALLLIVVLLVAQAQKTRPAMLLSAVVLVMVSISYPLMLRQDPEQIATTSPLVERVRENLPDGSRFAVISPGLPVLNPNLNAALGLPSVHTYNSLSSKRYQSLIKELGGKTYTYGRWNTHILPDFKGTAFWMSNIGVVLSRWKLNHENLQHFGVISGIHLHKVISRMGDSLQFYPPSESMEGFDFLQDPRHLLNYSPKKRLDQGDVLEYQVNVGPPSVLVLSQEFHADWRAEVYDQSAWVPAQTMVIKGVFQGVLLPQGTQRVRLEFRPWVRHAWIAGVIWLILLALLGLRASQKYVSKEHK